ncbi:MAG TPA: LLM class flavin-dependent oxidoreductase [Thermomicrobiales bacterium]|jgi:alkanesulfonate monooxygenase SsuD/methylene tetrahydromethanopterin reductase-like flavin-dependent oxidoreductase (luciferase family)
MTQLDFGVTIRPTPHGGTLAEMAQANARILAAAQTHDLPCWVIDHFQFGADPIMECLAFLAFHAGQHPGLRWGTLVLGQGYRNPALTAKMAATLQHLTNGRFILGVGAGDAESEHYAYGYPFPPARTRVAQLAEAAQIAKALWRGEPTTFIGAHYRVENALCIPAPSPPPTLMIGGGGERRTLRVVAEWADWWNADYYTPAEYAHKLGVLHAHCREVGRDPDQIVPSCYMGLSISRDPSRLTTRRSMGHRGEVHVVSGTPEEVVPQLKAFADVGMRHMQLNFLDFPRTESLDLFIEEVLPHFDRAGT